jgi:hypothetical protein
MRRQEVFDPISGNGRDFDIALAGEALDVKVRQPERDAKAFGQRPLSDTAIFLNFTEKLKVSTRL